MEELPVFVEVLNMKSLDGEGGSDHVAAPSHGEATLRFLLDRPGLLLMGAALLAVVAWVALNLR